MSEHKTGLMSDQLSKPTSVFGLRLWVVLGVCVGTAIVLLLFFITLWLASKSKKSTNNEPKIPIVSKEIQEIRIDQSIKPNRAQMQTHQFQDQEMITRKERGDFLLLMPPEEESPVKYHGIQIDIGKGHLISYPGSSGEAPRGGGGGGGNGGGGDQVAATVVPDVSHLGWGHWYTLRELEVATNSFAHENVIGEGGYGIVYHGVLEDNTEIAVKNLLNNRGQAEREFTVEVEAIGRVRHKNLVRLLGYCAEGAQRMLVYEYVNSGNLEQWLHGDVGPCSPLTWEIRMKIILGTAKGLTYLHDGLEPKVVHRDIKSSNILLDKQWNPKVSDFGLAKLLCSDSSYITTRVMGTFGYVAPEYASSGMLNERSDVYSFGILIMEIISGRNPVDYSRPPEEVNMIDWLKRMVSNRNPEGVLDPKLPEKPASRALKRALLVALRCVDPNAQKRPKMGHIVHMLEADDSPFREVCI
ncbi:serine/threonine-protein kinase [Populus alba x Populus x berolinensis]|uniref:non-specific serine/threonine protein kinase n=1 Tax=Populus alba x Populus x berolinensis TaxID=444605 RepID=A0AAD6W2Z4_9ROSI|nr:serine/threonine-protein kinase [Populus alba x Populus x berolinensis]KAJ6997383.1 serine/threonine-protein kinase [Populus alba x Populus x berolinensis]